MPGMSLSTGVAQHSFIRRGSVSAGSITINAERNADKAAVFKTVKDGKFVFLTTVKPQ